MADGEWSEQAPGWWAATVAGLQCFVRRDVLRDRWTWTVTLPIAAEPEEVYATDWHLYADRAEAMARAETLARAWAERDALRARVRELEKDLFAHSAFKYWQSGK